MSAPQPVDGVDEIMERVRLAGRELTEATDRVCSSAKRLLEQDEKRPRSPKNGRLTKIG